MTIQAIVSLDTNFQRDLKMFYETKNRLSNLFVRSTFNHNKILNLLMAAEKELQAFDGLNCSTGIDWPVHSV